MHGDSHRSHLRRPFTSTVPDLRRARETVEDVAGVPVRWFRPPYGAVSTATLVAARTTGLQLVLWTTWGLDWQPRATGRTVAANVARTFRPGATVLLHDSDITSIPGTWRSALSALPILGRQWARGRSAGRDARRARSRRLRTRRSWSDRRKSPGRPIAARGRHRAWRQPSRAAVVALVAALALTAAGCGAATSPGAAPPTIQVVTGLYPLAQAIQQVGGSTVSVIDVVPAGANPRTYRLGPAQIAAVAPRRPGGRGRADSSRRSRRRPPARVRRSMWRPGWRPATLMYGWILI